MHRKCDSLKEIGNDSVLDKSKMVKLLKSVMIKGNSNRFVLKGKINVNIEIK